jgi:hypothetical protein
MKIKNTSVSLAIVVLVLAGGLPLTAVADKAVTMDLRFAGSFINEALPSALIHTTAVGSPGRAETRGFGGTTVFGGFPSDCLGIPFGLSIIVTENPLIFTFQDLSLLFAKGGNGQICIDLATGNSVFEINITFMGGRGRFEGATGEAVIRGEAEPLSADGSFQGETGTIVGTIYVP